MINSIRTVIDKVMEYPAYVISGAAKNTYSQLSEEEKNSVYLRVGLVAGATFIATQLIPLPKILFITTAAIFTAIHEIHRHEKSYKDRNYFTNFCVNLAKQTKDKSPLVKFKSTLCDLVGISK